MTNFPDKRLHARTCVVINHKECVEAALKVGFKTLPGHHKPVNEDSFYADETIGLFVLADGMGGHNAGEVASSIAVREIVNTVRHGRAAERGGLAIVREALLNAHAAIVKSARAHADWSDMGTTAVLALFDRVHILIAHVGDSRAYAIRDGTIRLLTEDHTFVFDWVRQGYITPKEARAHEARHGLTMALGVDDNVEPAVSQLPFIADACLLLCSDGLTDMLEDKEILETVTNARDPQDACEALTRRANERGGPDDMTVILICY